MKIIQLVLISILILSGCTFFNSQKIELIYIHETPILSDFEFLTFKDKNDSLIFIISQNNFSDSTIYLNFEKLKENNKYLIELIPIEKGKVIKTIIRRGPSSFITENNKLIISNDTLIGEVYSSPNIIGQYYKK
jgi:hypothetical protein